jgi:putative hemolysin
MNKLILEIIFILVLILANGFFSSSEFALISLRKSRIKHLALEGNKKAQLVDKLRTDPAKFLATIQIGITLVGTLASVIGGARIVDALTPWITKLPFEWTQKGAEAISIGLVVIAITYLTLVLGELVPKYLALSYPEKITFKTAKLIKFLSQISFFIIKILTWSSQKVASIFFKRIPKELGFVTDEEVKFIVSEGREKGIFDETEEELIHSVLEFTDTQVKAIMTPRTEIVALELNTEWEKGLRIVTQEGYSRVPIYKDTLDNIVGIVHTKDMLNIMQNKELIILNDIIRKPYFVPDSKKISELLKDFQKKKIHLALVLDEFGGTAGLITLEDVIEEIFGEIQDEYDQETKEIVLLTDGSAIVKAKTPVKELNEALKSQLPEDKWDTIAGFVVNSLGRIPTLDEEFICGDLKFTVFEKSGHWVEKLKVEKIEEKKEEE